MGIVVSLIDPTRFSWTSKVNAPSHTEVVSGRDTFVESDILRSKDPAADFLSPVFQYNVVDTAENELLNTTNSTVEVTLKTRRSLYDVADDESDTRTLVKWPSNKSGDVISMVAEPRCGFVLQATGEFVTDGCFLVQSWEEYPAQVKHIRFSKDDRRQELGETFSQNALDDNFSCECTDLSRSKGLITMKVTINILRKEDWGNLTFSNIGKYPTVLGIQLGVYLFFLLLYMCTSKTTLEKSRKIHYKEQEEWTHLHVQNKDGIKSFWNNPKNTAIAAWGLYNHDDDDDDDQDGEDDQKNDNKDTDIDQRLVDDGVDGMGAAEQDALQTEDKQKQKKKRLVQAASSTVFQGGRVGLKRWILSHVLDEKAKSVVRKTAAKPLCTQLKALLYRNIKLHKFFAIVAGEVDHAPVQVQYALQMMCVLQYMVRWI